MLILQSGHAPAVRVYEVSSKLKVAEFTGHKFGVTCVAFSPNNKYLVSVGTQHDMVANVWNWRQNLKVASNKISSKVCVKLFICYWMRDQCVGCYLTNQVTVFCVYSRGAVLLITRLLIFVSHDSLVV